MSAGLIGTIQQWTAGLLGDRAFGTRERAVVDLVFAAAKGWTRDGSCAMQSGMRRFLLVAWETGHFFRPVTS
jgi:hypothetical protein